MSGISGFGPLRLPEDPAEREERVGGAEHGRFPGAPDAAHGREDPSAVSYLRDPGASPGAGCVPLPPPRLAGAPGGGCVPLAPPRTEAGPAAPRPEGGCCPALPAGLMAARFFGMRPAAAADAAARLAAGEGPGHLQGGDGPAGRCGPILAPPPGPDERGRVGGWAPGGAAAAGAARAEGAAAAAGPAATIATEGGARPAAPFEHAFIAPPDREAMARAWAAFLGRPENAALAAEALSGAASRAAPAHAADPRIALLGADPARSPEALAAEVLEVAGGSPARAAVILAGLATRGPKEAALAARIFLALPAEAQAAALPHLVRAAPLPLLRQILGASSAEGELVRSAVALYHQAGGDPTRLLEARAPLRDPRLLAAVLGELPAARAAAFLAAALPASPSQAEVAALAEALATIGGEHAAALLERLPPGLRERLAAAGGGTAAQAASAAGAGASGGAGGAAAAGGRPSVPELKFAAEEALARYFGARAGDAAEARALGGTPAGPAAAVGGAGAAAAAAFLGSLAALLKASVKDGAQVLDEALGPLGGHPFAQIEDRGGGEDGPDGTAEDALELLAAMRSLDFAGLKAVALDRAAQRAAELRLSELLDEDARPKLDRVHETMALLLASDPVGIARFGREHPEAFPAASARNALGELLRASPIVARRALLASLAQVLRASSAGSGTPRAFAAGYLAGAAAAAAAAIASGGAGDHDPARRAQGYFEAAAGLADAAGPAPAGPAEREGAGRLLDERQVEIDAALARAETGGGAGAAGLLRAIEAPLLARFQAMDPDGGLGLASELEHGLALFRRSAA